MLKQKDSKAVKKYREELFTIMSSFQNKKELEAFYHDLLTPSEIDIFAERIQIIKGLLQGKTQRKVAEELSVSIATVERGASQLKYGKGAFKKVLSSFLTFIFVVAWWLIPFVF